MKRFLIAIALLAASPALAEDRTCIMVGIWRDGIVTVDWPCVEKTAASQDDNRGWAWAMLAVRDGKAHAVASGDGQGEPMPPYVPLPKKRPVTRKVVHHHAPRAHWRTYPDATHRLCPFIGLPPGQQIDICRP